MRVTNVRIRNFRSLVDVTIPMDDTTVIVGENNSGKSALIDAIRAALTRVPSRRGSAFAEYDFHLPDQSSDPKASPPISVELEFAESRPDEWPQALIQALAEVVQTDPVHDVHFIRLRVTSQYDPTTKSFDTAWHFLSADGQQLVGRAGLGSNLPALLQYVPVFYLSALRDADDEFSSGSHFWGQILRSVDMPEDKRLEIQRSLEQLNSEILQADPRLGKVTDTMAKMRGVVSAGGKGAVAIRALPQKPWELMSKSEIVVRSLGTDAWFPLKRHGQGVQSLAVLFLFQAFVEHVLKSAFQPESEPILALEEPEAHLHPQAARSLWERVRELPGQKIITTHSTHFIQHVPLKNLRLLRRVGPATEVHSLPRSFPLVVPGSPGLHKFCSARAPKYSFDQTNSRLEVFGTVDDGELTALKGCFKGFPEPDRSKIHKELEELARTSLTFIPDEELSSLETFAQRMRGEIFFSRAWLLCEGPSDYFILRCFAEMLGTPLDAGGVSVVDYQNSGTPGVFASLARAFGFPWHMVCDHDQGGNDHIADVCKRGFDPLELKHRIHQLQEGDLEHFLIRNGFQDELTDIASSLGAKLAVKPTDARFQDALAEFLGAHKVTAASMLAKHLLSLNASASRVPRFFKDLIELVVGEANA